MMLLILIPTRIPIPIPTQTPIQIQIPIQTQILTVEVMQATIKLRHAKVGHQVKEVNLSLYVFSQAPEVVVFPAVRSY